MPDLHRSAPVHPPGGQRSTTLAALAEDHGNDIRPEGELTGIGTVPHFAIGQRALLVPYGNGTCCGTASRCSTTAPPRTSSAVAASRPSPISHPHYYTTWWSGPHALRLPDPLHAGDAEWIMRPDPAVERWRRDLELGHGLTLIRAAATSRAAPSCTARTPTERC